MRKTIQEMKDELEKFKLLKQAKEELGDEFFQQYCSSLNISSSTPPPNIIPEVEPNISLEEKTTRANQFLSNIDEEITKLFKNKHGGWHINTQRNNRLEYQIEIEPESEIDQLVRKAVTSISKARIKLDSKDGEFVFAYIFNNIFEYLGFSKRFEVDDKHYDGIGDNGDFKYGLKRLDIKLRQRQKVNYRWDLWVNAKDAEVGYNEFILVRRDGDDAKVGGQRRLTIAGYATVDMVKANKPIARKKTDSTLKYEVKEEELLDLKDLISIVVKEVLSTEE